MKLLGLIGGVSPEATIIYYRLLGEAARAKFGPNHSANVLVYTLDYGVMFRHYENKDWERFSAEAAVGAKRLAAAGVDAIVITSNTSHIAAEAVATASGLPVIHILDVLTTSLNERGVQRPLLLGTPEVMGGDHYLPAFAKRYNGDVLTPTPAEQAVIGRIILDELVHGEILDDSREELLAIVAAHRDGGVDGLILGCTELCMILSQEHIELPVFDTTALHAAAAAAFAFGEG